MLYQLLVIGAVLRVREKWQHFSTWLLEPALLRELDRKRVRLHALAMRELRPTETQ